MNSPNESDLFGPIQAALQANPVRPRRGERFMRRAAVALLLREVAGDLELLFIRRAERPGDPWSGHMAFPGGRMAPSDPSPVHAAVREVREEIRCALDPMQAIGELPHLLSSSHRSPWPMAVVPHVFAVHQPLQPRATEEVQESMWIPLRFFEDPGNRETFRYPIAGLRPRFECYRWEGRRIWGMSLRMLDALLERLTSS